jgi:hypothetical protein
LEIFFTEIALVGSDLRETSDRIPIKDASLPLETI